MPDNPYHHSLALIEAVAKWRHDQQWQIKIEEEAARQILETSDADALDGRWPALVRSVTKEEST